MLHRWNRDSHEIANTEQEHMKAASPIFVREPGKDISSREGREACASCLRRVVLWSPISGTACPTVTRWVSGGGAAIAEVDGVHAFSTNSTSPHNNFTFWFVSSERSPSSYHTHTKWNFANLSAIHSILRSHSRFSRAVSRTELSRTSIPTIATVLRHADAAGPAFCLSIVAYLHPHHQRHCC
jgi:hypothetical protein